MSVEFRRIRPAPDLTPFIRYYWVLKGKPLDASLHPIFPDGCTEIVLNLGPPACEQLPHGDPVAQPAAMLVGQMTRPVLVLPGAELRMVGVKLAPWGAVAVLGPEAVNLRDDTAGLGDLGAGGLEVLREQLDDCGDDAAMGVVLDSAMRARLGMSPVSRLDRITKFASALAKGPGCSLDGWARTLGCSARTLERSFERWVGLSPKELARLLRFQQALRLAASRPDMNWAVVAASAGYSDQAHLGRDFRQFAGASPTTAAAESTSVSAVFVG
jgi:AraC-like DNA-binding protein